MELWSNRVSIRRLKALPFRRLRELTSTRHTHSNPHIHQPPCTVIALTSAIDVFEASKASRQKVKAGLH